MEIALRSDLNAVGAWPLVFVPTKLIALYQSTSLAWWNSLRLRHNVQVQSYQYLESSIPDISRVVPPQGVVDGGTLVTIVGGQFIPSLQYACSFGSR